jgi:hypothetical protein
MKIFRLRKNSEKGKKMERRAHPKTTTVSQSRQWLM